ncbi:MAG: ubiquinol-cytochrome c reductase cytochrome b subunit [Actinomycetota bacterium]|jgi:ubiquinol-cytochrome c reductase cytochrome b subunit|nr:ubiquinol-cytochrome c reductase cytochrome b subunit [Actinomycetota bacterium]
MILKRTSRWIDDRLGTSGFARSALNKVFPDHWSFMLGEIALYCFVILLLTGTFLTFFFDPSSRPIVYDGSYGPLHGATVSEAFNSTLRLSFDVRAGLLMRQIHHWAAIVFIAAVIVHLCRIFFTGAFRRPREINWMIGVGLLILAIFNGFTGYSLPDDLLSGTGLRIAYSIALSIPFIGTWIAFLIFGGEFPSHEIITRLFVVHVLLIPALIIGLLSAHLAILWRQKHTQFAGPGRTEHNVVGSRLWPTYAAKAAGLFCATLAVLSALGGLAQINPVWLYGPFEPSAVTSPAQPDWFLGWVEGALRLFPPWEFTIAGHLVPNPFFPAVLLPGVTFGLLLLWPFVERFFTKDDEQHELLDRPRDRPLRTGVGAGVLAFYSVLFFAASNDYLAKVLDVPVAVITNVFRVAVFALPVLVGWLVYRLMKGLSTSGASNLLHVPASAFRRR